VREEFNEGNEFCKKITYKSLEDPKSVLAQFRNSYNPRIAVTVDMIATGTDVKPLECLLFMRDVKSRNYFEQMKGRGTRTINYDDLKKVTPSAILTKTHFVIVDAVGVTKTLKTDSRPLERIRAVPLKDLLYAVMMGTAKDEDTFISAAGRLARLEKQITGQEKEKFAEKAGGKSINQVVHELLDAYDPDKIEAVARTQFGIKPEPEQETAEEQLTLTEEQLKKANDELIRQAASTFTGELITYIEDVRKSHEQIIDTVNLDTVEFSGWDKQAKDKAKDVVDDFKAFLERHKDEITALRIFYNQPYNRRELTYKMIKEVLEVLKAEKPLLAPARVWQAYEQLEKVNGHSQSPKNELTALVALIRRVTGIDEVLTPYDKTVDKNFKNWVFKKQAGAALKFNEEQMEWLRMIKEHIAASIHLDREKDNDDLEFAPFDAKGGIGKMYQVFGDEMDNIINEMNEALVA
jgi:type I restriction enzyme R subunit